MWKRSEPIGCRSGGGVGGDEAADALRYLVATKVREVVVRKLRGW